MKNIIKILAIFILIFSLFWIFNVNAGISWLTDFTWNDSIKNHSLTTSTITGTWDISQDVETLWLKIFTVIKYIVSALLVVFIVYAWIQMILSMWSDEEQLSTSKRQLWYTLIWLIFINIPFQIYSIFVTQKSAIDWSINGTWASQLSTQEESVFINIFAFDNTINWWIISFIETWIFSIAIFIIVLAGIKIMTSWWDEEDIKEAKTKILWSLVWLIFIWFIESWQALVYNGKISDWANMFETIENLLLFFAWPVAIFFLTLAWYYYITSNGDDEKVKKAKSIIMNTLIATVILLASHAFLKDLITL